MPVRVRMIWETLLRIRRVKTRKNWIRERFKRKS